MLVKFPIHMEVIEGRNDGLKGDTHHSGSPISGHYTAAVKFKGDEIAMMQ